MMEKKKLGVFGGTFNPVHLGHLHLCKSCQEQCEFDQILLIPTNQPPHKETVNLASNRDRLEMLRLAVREFPYMKACGLEYQMGGKSYTINTLKRLKELYQDTEISLIMGSDMLRSFHTWRSYQEILSTATLTVGARCHAEYEELVELRDSFQEYREKIKILKISVIELSSTQIRSLLKKGMGRELLPPAVFEYICKRGLYQ